MVPWCNRIPGGCFRFADRSVRLPLNLDNHAIHGEAYLLPWEADGDALVFHGEGRAWPWEYEARQTISVSGSVLSMKIAVTNRASSPMPAGIGLHPWFSNESPLHVALPASLIYATSECIPVGSPSSVAGRTDRRQLSPVPWGLDTVWTGLTTRSIDLAWPSWGVRAIYSFGAAASHVVMAAFEAQNAVAIEPITHVPGGVPDNMHVLAPGASLSLEHVLTVVPYRVEASSVSL
jgi:aldose 1-epimerase